MIALSSWAARNYGAEAAYQAALGDLAAGAPAARLYERISMAVRFAPEHGSAWRVRGQSSYSLAQKSEADSTRVLLEMALHDLETAHRTNVADGSVLLSMALARAGLGAGDSAVALMKVASARRPGFAEPAWLLARSLPAGSVEQQRAYRLVTQLRPAATPLVIREVARLPGVAPERFVAPLPAVYRAWAWSVTDAARGMAVAQAGLALVQGPEDGQDAAWLEYYLGLKLSESDPGASLAWFRKALSRIPGEQAMHRNFGFALLKCGRTEEAKAEFQKSIHANADIANAAHLGLAQAEEALGAKRRAMAIYQRLETNPRLEPWVRQAAGIGLRRLERKL